MERSGVGFGMFYTPWKTNMEPDNPWLVEENSLPWDQDVRVYVSFRECRLLSHAKAPICHTWCGPFVDSTWKLSENLHSAWATVVVQMIDRTIYSIFSGHVDSDITLPVWMLFESLTLDIQMKSDQEQTMLLNAIIESVVFHCHQPACRKIACLRTIKGRISGDGISRD